MKNNFHKTKGAQKPRRFSAHKKNLDTMKLLVSDSEFKELVKEIREYLKIPENGFSKNEDTEKWTHKTNKRSDAVLSSKKFLQQEAMIRDKLNREEIDVFMANKQSGLLHEKVPWNYLNNRSLFLADKFNIPHNFKESIRRYLIIGAITVPMNNFESENYPVRKKPSDMDYVLIRIYSKLTKDEFEDLKEYIDFVAPNLPDYNFQSLENIDRDLKIEEWYKNKERLDLVTSETYRMTAREIAEDLLGDPGKAKKVYEIIQEQTRKRNRRFRKLRD